MNTFQDVIDQQVGGINWEWDNISREFGRGTAIGTFSFSGQPTEFSDGGIIGGMLVRGRYKEDPESESIIVNVDVGYYNKLPGGEGKLHNVVRAGDHILLSNGSGGWIYDSKNNPKPLWDAVKQVIGEISKNPPSDALSKSPDAIRKRDLSRYKHELNKSQSDKALADRESYGDIEWVVEQLMDSGKFGVIDLNLYLNNRYNSDEERSANRQKIIEELESWGLEFVPRFPRQLATTIGRRELCSKLFKMASYIDSSESPSRNAMIDALDNIILRLI